MSWDLTFKGGGKSDYVVGQVWAKENANYYLIDQVRGQWDFTETVSEFKKLCRRYPQTTYKLVEDAANGAALKSHLQRSIDGIILVKPDKAKELRLQRVLDLFESGNVFVPRQKSVLWVDHMLKEWFSFPNGKNDDTVDATTQALNHLRTTNRTFVAPIGQRRY